MNGSRVVLLCNNADREGEGEGEGGRGGMVAASVAIQSVLGHR